MIFVDADVWIDFFCDVAPSSQAVTKLVRQRRAAMSVVTLYELSCGVGRPEQQTQLERLAGLVEPAPLTREAALLAGEHYRRLRGVGQLIDNQDLLLAGSALAVGRALLTRNCAHFSRIEGLEIVSPADVVSQDEGET